MNSSSELGSRRHLFESGARPSAPGAQSNNFGVLVLWKVLEYIKCVSNVQGNLRLVAISGDCFALPLTAITRYVAQVSLTWKPPLSESSKASEIESKETFRTSLNQRGAKVSLDLLQWYS